MIGYVNGRCKRQERGEEEVQTLDEVCFGNVLCARRRDGVRLASASVAERNHVCAGPPHRNGLSRSMINEDRGRDTADAVPPRGRACVRGE